MKKEAERFGEGTLFEGLPSLRVLIQNQELSESNPYHHNCRKILTVYYDKERAKRAAKEYHWLCHRAAALGFEIALRDREWIDTATIGNSHGGIAILTDQRQFLSPETMPVSPNGFHILLQGIEDPYNFGYALRSLYAAGADGVWLGQHNWMSAAGVVCRSSAGASELLPIALADDMVCIDHLKKHGYRIVCADLRDSVPVWDADLSLPLLLVIGGEKRGISRNLLARSDLRVHIDYSRTFEASLSAASAATIVGFEVHRQNRI